MRQPVLFDEPEVLDAPGEPQNGRQDAKFRGAVFTKASVVEFMLDLVGYTPDKDLWKLRLLEPSCGGGGFVLAVAHRLISAWRRSNDDDTVLDGALCAVELDGPTIDQTRQVLTDVLISEGLSMISAKRIVAAWLVRADFLTTPIGRAFDFIVGNPPYIRQELLAPQRLAMYRRLYPTMIGRADIYVCFFEKSLGLLASGGAVCFICSDAWTRNDYGRELRRLVVGDFALRVYVDMYGLDAFESDVGAYTSITVIERGTAGPVRTATPTSTKVSELSALAAALRTGAASARIVPAPRQGDGPWLLRGDSRQEVVREMEVRLPTLEQSGCRVGIGVATGADNVFVARFDDLPVEASRKLPLAVNKDVSLGKVQWHGMGVVNPWDDVGGLVDLRVFPRLAAYLAPHRTRLAARHTAKDNPTTRWYKTIDRITPALARQPKLLVPDIRGDGNAIAYEEGNLYPHHNLYHITSHSWDLYALQAVLRSGMARLFVDTYAVRIGGGYLRFQAQYLRRIRIPAWQNVDGQLRQRLREAGIANAEVSPEVLEQIYGLDKGRLDFMGDWQ